MSDVSINLSKSDEWRQAYSQAIRSVEFPTERRFIKLLAMPISRGDKKKISKRVQNFENIVKNSPIQDLERLEERLSNDRSGLGRLYDLELSTSLRSGLRRRLRRRISRHKERKNRLTEKAKMARATTPTARVKPKTARPLFITKQMKQEAEALDVGANAVGDFSFGAPLEQDDGTTIVRINGVFPNKLDARTVIVDPFTQRLSRISGSSVVEELYDGDVKTGQQLWLRIFNATALEIIMATEASRQMYADEVSRIETSEEQYQSKRAMKAWQNVFKKVGNLYSPVPFVEFTDQGLEFSMNPANAVPIKGFKDMRKLKGYGVIRKKSYKPWVKNPAFIGKLKKLFKAGVNKSAWRKAINDLSEADKLLLKRLKQAEKDCLKLIRAGKEGEAYALVKKWRKPATGLYNKVRDKYWKNSTVREQWANTGADMSKNAPKMEVALKKGGRNYRRKMVVTIEHLVRRTDNPFMAISSKHLAKSLGYENSNILETIRRIGKGRNTVWPSRLGGPIEEMVRRIEGKLD